MKKIFFKIFLVISLLSVSFSQLYIEGNMITGNRPLAIPVGAEDVVLFRFSIGSNDDNDTWHQLVFEKNPEFSNDWFKIYIYHDWNPNGRVDADEKSHLKNNPANDDYGSSRITINQLWQEIETQTTRDYIVAVNISNTADVNAVLRLTPNLFLADDGTSATVSANIKGYSFGMSRLISYTEIGATKNYFIGDAELDLFQISLRLTNDTICWVTFNVDINMDSSHQEGSVGEIRIYSDEMLFVTSEIRHQSNFQIGFPHGAVQTTTKNFYIRYYNSNQNDLGVSFNIQLNSIIGAHPSSRTKGYQHKTIEPASLKTVNIPGVDIKRFEKTPLDFGYIGDYLQVFEVDCYSFFEKTTINTIELAITGDYIFSNVNSENVVQHVLVQDSDGETILTFSVGSYVFLDTETIELTLSLPILKDNDKKLKIAYVLTENILEQKKFSTKLQNITFFSTDGALRGFDDFFALEDYFAYNILGEAIVRIGGHFVTSSIDIIFPRGGESQQIAYLDFSYSGVPIFASEVHIDTFVIDNKSSLPISNLKFSLIQDTNKNMLIDAEDLVILGEDALVHRYDDITNRVTINTTKIRIDTTMVTQGYFLMLEILPSADTGVENVALEFFDILYYKYISDPPLLAKHALFDNFQGSTITVSVSGLIMEHENSEFALPFRKQESFDLATFSIISLVEFTKEISFKVEIKTKSEDSLGSLHIIKDYTGDPQAIKTMIASLNMVNMVINTVDLYSFAVTTYDPAEITRNYMLIYYPNLARDAGTTFDVIIRNITGSGYRSGLNTTCFSDNLTANFGLSGLKVTLDSALVEGKTIEYMEVPVFRFDFKAFYDDVTFNGVVLKASSNFKYTSQGDIDRIYKLLLYQDVNNNLVWDHDDFLRLEEEMTGAQLEEFFLTINEMVISGSENDSLFVVYMLGLSGNIFSPVTARSSSQKFHYTHSGDAQIIEVNRPLQREIILEPVDVIFTPGKDLFVTNNYEGSYDVPILSFYLNRIPQSSHVTSYNFILETNWNLYADNDSGIKSIKLIEDVDKSGSYTSKDIILDVVNDSSRFGNRVTLNVGSISSFIDLQNPYGKTYLILYTFGQKISDLTNISEEILRPRLYTTEITTASAKTAGLFPFPRNTRYMQFLPQKLEISLASITPNKWITGDLNIKLKVANLSASSVTINSVYPQFYETSISSLNVTYLYNISTTQNFPLILNPLEEKEIPFVISTDLEFKPDRLFLDALVDYVFDSRSIKLHRRDLSEWKALITKDETIDIDMPENEIFYLDYPNYIKQIIRSESNIAFLNGDIIGSNEYLIVYLKETLNIDANKIIVKLNGANLNMYNSEPNYRYDKENNSIRLGKFAKGEHTLELHFYDNAGNPYPKSVLNIFVYDPNQFYIKDLLAYPSKKALDSFAYDPLKIGFQLSKSCEVLLYLFNSRGENIWTHRYNATLVDDYYQIVDFDGVLDNGRMIKKGMYILKAIIIENGKKKDAKITTRFIIN